MSNETQVLSGVYLLRILPDALFRCMGMPVLATEDPFRPLTSSGRISCVCSRHGALTMETVNFYESWELFWPVDVTWGELHGAANDD